jgi:hypothetical protein
VTNLECKLVVMAKKEFIIFLWPKRKSKFFMVRKEFAFFKERQTLFCLLETRERLF